jgi:hypothetical protein
MSITNVFISRIKRTVELLEDVLVVTKRPEKAAILEALSKNDFQSLETKLLGTIKTEIEFVLPYDIEKFKMMRNAVKVTIAKAKKEAEIEKETNLENKLDNLKKKNLKK